MLPNHLLFAFLFCNSLWIVHGEQWRKCNEHIFSTSYNSVMYFVYVKITKMNRSRAPAAPMPYTWHLAADAQGKNTVSTAHATLVCNSLSAKFKHSDILMNSAALNSLLQFVWQIAAGKMHNGICEALKQGGSAVVIHTKFLSIEVIHSWNRRWDLTVTLPT